eukprot:TRINITY_DN2110_c0_g1_i2.p1 TRINITY_DN2110_c0_g1~~TRINITY_DN2110_c0_g1_i2.p1  ORF type:complete len:106 (-),score=3.49 TRINITY_DN2110_c0_g1_i2:299-616(-)
MIDSPITHIRWLINGQMREGGHLEKCPSQVVFADIKSLYQGPPCNFLFKTQDYTKDGQVLRDSCHWTLINNDLSPVPIMNSSEIVVMPHPLLYMLRDVKILFISS